MTDTWKIDDGAPGVSDDEDKPETELNKHLRQVLLDYAASKGLQALGQEYVDEAEHHEGRDFWQDNFGDLGNQDADQAVKDDFDLYVGSSDS